MDLERVDLIIKFCLAFAGQKDVGERELGTIHLIKYVYLADLFYAELNKGETFTGIPWRFHHFGPWSVDVWDRVEPVASEIGASKRTITSYRYENDAVRFSVEDEELLHALESQIPFSVSVRLSQLIKQFGDDTVSLLNHVYTTTPMLSAAPEDLLDFESVAEAHDKEAGETGASADAGNEQKLSKTKQKRIEKERQDRKREFQKRLSEKARPRLVAPPTPPPYDKVFFEGLNWLDSLAGEPIEECEGEIEVQPDIWKSRARGEREP